MTRKKLKGLAVPSEKAYEWGNSRKGYWRIAHSPILEKTLDNAYWHNQGLESLYERYTKLRQTYTEPPYTERYVRWCERSEARRPPPTRLLK